MKIPKPVVGVAVAVAVVGMGVASAEVLPPLAASDGPIVTDPSTTAPSDSTTTSSTTAPSLPTTAPTPSAATSPEADGGHVARSYDGCGDFTQGTHGDYVSKIAHDPASTPDQKRAAAHSSCGKPVPSLEPGPQGDDSKPDADEAPETGDDGNRAGDVPGGRGHRGAGGHDGS